MLEVRDLHKVYGEKTAVQSISFKVERGEFYSLLGPNGAGKSTTLSILSTLLKPSSGTVLIDGIDVVKEPLSIRKMIGVVPQEIALYEDLSAFDNLMFFGSLYPMGKNDLRIRVNTLLGDFGLSDRAYDKIRTYSGGMKRRINIAAALLHDPKLLFMDEPTVGIDPQSRNNIYEAISRLKNEGKTILYTTHYMEEAEKFSDRIGIIDKGKIIAEGTLRELISMGDVQEEIIVHSETISSFEHQEFRLNEHIQVKGTSDALHFTCKDLRSSLPAIMNFCFEKGIVIRTIDVRYSNLESVFLSLTGNKLRD